MKKIAENEIINLLNTINGSEFFGIKYIKKDGTEREAVAQLHVFNPRNTALTPKGTGESAATALEMGRLKYYEAHHKEVGGGVYRQCALERVVSLNVKGVTYQVLH
jgi:hypothetical protein